MSQEGGNLPQELEGSHDQASAPHGSIPIGLGSSTPTGSNFSTTTKLASAVNNPGSSEHASPAMLSADEDNNIAFSSKIANPSLLYVDDNNNNMAKIDGPTLLLADEEKGNNAAGPKLPIPTMLHDCGDNKVGSHVDVDNNATFHAGDGNNIRSKIASLAVPQATMDNTTASKLDNPTVLHAGKDNNTGLIHPNPTVLQAKKDMDNNTGQPKFTSPVLLHASEDNKGKIKLDIQAVSRAGGNTRSSSRLTRSVTTVLHAAKDNASKLSIQVVPRPHASKDNNAGSSRRLTRSATATLHAAKDDASKLAIQVVNPQTGKDNNSGSSKAVRPAMVDVGKSNAKGKNNISSEQQPAHEADVGSGSGKHNAAVVEDADPNLHVFTERERRKKMKNMFSTLHSLLPQLPNKADKATIVGETVISIKMLERTVQKLENLKLERKRALAVQQQQQQLGASSSRAPFARHPAPVLPLASAASSASTGKNVANMVHSWEAQQAALLAAANKTLAASAGGSSSSSSSTGAAAQLPRGAAPFPAPPTSGMQTWSGHNVALGVAKNEAYINLHCPQGPGRLTKALSVLERHHIEVVTTTISTKDGLRMYGIQARANPAPASARFPENLCAEDRFKLAVSEMVQLLNI